MKISYSLILTLSTCLLAVEISAEQRGKTKRDKKTNIRSTRQLNNNSNNNADQMVQNILRWLQDVYGSQGRRSRSYMYAQDLEMPYYFASARIDHNAFRQGSLREYLPPTPGEKPRPFTSKPSTVGAGVDEEGNFVDSGYPPAGITPQPPFTIITNPATGGITGVSGSGIPGEEETGGSGGSYYPTQSTGRPTYTPTPYPGRPGYSTEATEGPGYPSYQTPGPEGPEQTPGQTIGTPEVTPGYPSGGITGDNQGYPTSSPHGFTGTSPNGFTGYPSGRPTQPSEEPGYPGYPTSAPSGFTGYPSGRPTGATGFPTGYPSGRPTPGEETVGPTEEGQTEGPEFTSATRGTTRPEEGYPTGYPSGGPTVGPGFPTARPTGGPTGYPTGGPTGYPTGVPSGYPTVGPTGFPTARPTTGDGYPTGYPTGGPTGRPGFPTGRPTTDEGYPTGGPTGRPGYPTGRPTTGEGYPTGGPTGRPGYPTGRPTTGEGYPTGGPTGRPGYPTGRPTTSEGYPTGGPTGRPGFPTGSPTTGEGYPTGAPTARPGFPTVRPPGGTGYPSGPTGPPAGETQSPTEPAPGENETPSESFPGFPTSRPPGVKTESPTEEVSEGVPGFPTARPPGLPTAQPPGFPTARPPGFPTVRPPGQPTGVPGEGQEPTGTSEPGKTVPPPTDDDLKHPPHIHALDVQCAKDMMTINIEFNREFNGVIYSKGYYNMPECRYINENSGQTKYTFTVNLNMCGTEFVNAFDTEGQSYLENVLVLQNELGIQEVWDTVRSVRCLWEGNLKEQLSVTLMVGMLSQEIVTFSGDTAMAKLDVLLGRGPFGQPASGLVKIGEPMTLVVSVSGDPGFDVQVKDCRATDSSGDNIVPLTDDSGCILKPKLFGSFQKTRNTGETGASIIAYAYFNAFKFPDVMDIMIECNIELCKTDCEMCPDPNPQLEPARRRRRDLYGLNETLHDGLRMSKHLRVVLPEDLASAAELLHEGVCMSTQNFVYASSFLISLLTASCFFSTYLWFKTQKIKSKI